MSGNRFVLALLPALALLVVAPASARALEDLSPALPPETIAYTRVAGLEELLEELGALETLDPQSRLADVFRTVIGQGLTELSEESGIPYERLTEALGSIAGVHGALFGVGPRFSDLDFIGALETTNPGLLRELFDQIVGEQASFAGEVAGVKVEAVEAEDGVTIYFAFRGSLLFTSTRPERIGGILEALASPPEVSLAKLPKYKDAVLRAGEGTTVSAWVDVQRFLHLIESNMRRRDSREFKDASRLLELWRMRAVSVVSGNGVTRARVTFSPGHRWLSAVRGAAGSGALRAYFPETALFGVIDCGSIKDKIAALRALLGDEKLIPPDLGGDEMREGLAEMEEMFAVELGELAETLGDEWGLFIAGDENLPGEGMDEGLVMLFAIGSAEEFDAVLERLLVSPAVQELEQEMGRLGEQDYRGARLFAPDLGGDEEVPCLAIHEGVLLLSGNIRALRAAIDAKADGRSFFSSSPSFGVLPRSFTKLAALDLRLLLLEERDFTPLLDLVTESVRLAATLDEAPGRLDVWVNQPGAGFFAFLVGGEMLSDMNRGERRACVGNLEAIYAAGRRYRSEKGEIPTSLEALVPDYLPKDRLVCPLDRDGGGGCSYRLIPAGPGTNEWSILAWCPHRLHGRIVLRLNGEAETMREKSFLRQLLEQGVKPR